MYEDMRVKYLLVNMKYRRYLKWQVGLIAVLLIAALPFFLYTRDSSNWMLKNAWWLCLVLAVLEVFEGIVAVSRAKKAYNPQGTE
ncbi:MAG: hypothetical protein QGH94_07095 [Phycisphaerae bacterium]|jgi:phosphatidylglycerophosphate synthase|nr:hypothetical protein [Phycisphaerae bacterium]